MLMWPAWTSSPFSFLWGAPLVLGLSSCLFLLFPFSLLSFSLAPSSSSCFQVSNVLIPIFYSITLAITIFSHCRLCCLQYKISTGVKMFHCSIWNYDINMTSVVMTSWHASMLSHFWFYQSPSFSQEESKSMATIEATISSNLEFFDRLNPSLPGEDESSTGLILIVREWFDHLAQSEPEEDGLSCSPSNQ